MNDIVKIRPYQPADYRGLHSFLNGVFSELGRDFLPDGKDADIREIDKAYIHNGGSFHVVDDQGEIRGCVGVRRLTGETAELKRLYLAQERRGSGLGRALCLKAIEDARNSGCKFLRLDTTANSQSALGLFRKLGFYEITRYNSDPFAEIFMEKELGQA